MINKITISLILLLLFGCSSKVAFPVILEQSGDAAYGYTKENPIRMGFSDDLVENVDLCRYFISRLRTKDMIGFYIDSRYSLADPKYKNTLLDAYTIISDNKTDTLMLFLDIYHADSVFIPSGLYKDTTNQSRLDSLMFTK